MAISVTEKEHIRELIEKRINAEIERISIENKSDADDIKARARTQAINALGITQAITDLDALELQIERLNEKRLKLEQKTLEFLDIDTSRTYNCNLRQAINAKISSASVSYEKALIDAHPKLMKINELKAEKDNLLQTIWIATSNKCRSRGQSRTN